ncbi:MAG: DUF4422 domain-containing protein [Ruminiclostridium sp.]|nr:DUF4422 domain-containing protein [Ruminiclostridium sp.]
MSDKRPRIHIAVACHKPSRLPANDILVPVQVNSAAAKNRMDMEHDDDGDNISAKNSSYCELTAQYWEWRNVDADYYGLCHYRRFLCFTYPEKIGRNNRKQIDAEAIDDWSVKRFGLDDEEAMRRVIEANDVVTGEEQNVSRLYTPRGNQPTAMKHWKAHDRALIMNEDLDKMLRILKEEAPQLGKDTVRYLNGRTFTGFNCFVMKKELFNELCEIEFRVLERLEKEVDLTKYCTQLSRIYGFMGEIISSGFIYHIKKRGAKVTHVPLVYFNNTDEEKRFPLTDGSAIPILFYHIADRAEFFAATWQSFLTCQNPAQRYDAIIFNLGMKKPFRDTIVSMAAGYDNISVRFVEDEAFVRRIIERFADKKIKHKTEKQKKGDEEMKFPALPFLLDSLVDLDEVLVIGDRTLLQAAPDELWSEKLGEGQVAAAPLDAHMLARANDIYPETELNYLGRQVGDVWDYHSTTAMKVDLAAYRKIMDCDKLLGSCGNTNGYIRDDTEVLNVCLHGHFKTVKQNWCVWYESNPYLEYQLPYAPMNVYRELLKARQEPYVAAYMKNDPYDPIYTELSKRFWEEARKTPCYEIMLDRKTQVAMLNAKKPAQLTRRMFRKGTKLHAVVSHMFPKDSLRYRFVKKVLSVFHAE